ALVDEPPMMSLEEALPTDDLPLIDAAPANEAVAAPKKPGLFGRMFGRKSKEQKALEALPPVDERDIAAAAADALEVVAESAFPPSEDAPSFAGDAFAIAPEEPAPAEEPASFEASTLPMDVSE